METHKKSGVNLGPEELERYSRHITLSEIGIHGQEKLKASSVLCIGSGGLGSPLLLYLAAAGVGRLGIVDCDQVETSNLQRQIIHSTNSVGKSKVISARNRILEINPFCLVDVFETFLTGENALDIISKFDLVCDCTDNFPSRYLINDSCVILGKANIFGSIDHFEGQATVFNLNIDSPNYRDLVPEPPPPGLIPSCEEGGVIGVLPGLIGIIQATEAIKIITGIGETLDKRLLVFNALTMNFRKLNLLQTEAGKGITRLIDYNEFCSPGRGSNNSPEQDSFPSISVSELKNQLKTEPENILLLDVRNTEETTNNSIDGAKFMPLKDIQAGEKIELIRELSARKRIYVYCKSGARSIKALIELRNQGIQSINVKGGIDAWNNEILRSQ